MLVFSLRQKSIVIGAGSQVRCASQTDSENMATGRNHC